MSTQVDGMRKLADSLVSSAEVVVAAEKILHLEAAAAAGIRVADLAQMSANTDEAITAMAAARVEQAVADVAARADAEATRSAWLLSNGTRKSGPDKWRGKPALI